MSNPFADIADHTELNRLLQEIRETNNPIDRHICIVAEKAAQKQKDKVEEFVKNFPPPPDFTLIREDHENRVEFAFKHKIYDDEFSVFVIDGLFQRKLLTEDDYYYNVLLTEDDYYFDVIKDEEILNFLAKMVLKIRLAKYKKPTSRRIREWWNRQFAK